MEANPYASPQPPANIPGSASSATITEGILNQLAGTRPWVRLISVIMLIGAAFLVLGGIAMFFMGAAVFAASAGKGGSSAVPTILGPVMGIFYLVFAALYIYPAMKLWNYANRITALIQTRTSIDLEAALNEQRAFWKFVGIVVLAVIALYVLIIVIAIIAGIAGTAFAN